MNCPTGINKVIDTEGVNCTCVSLVEQLCQVYHPTLDRRDSLDDELWLVSGGAGLHIHTDLVHIHLVLHALLSPSQMREKKNQRNCLLSDKYNSH